MDLLSAVVTLFVVMDPRLDPRRLRYTRLTPRTSTTISATTTATASSIQITPTAVMPITFPPPIMLRAPITPPQHAIIPSMLGVTGLIAF
jgi:hypothetical protein